MGRIPSIGGIADAGALENSYIELFKARDARAARLWEYAEILYSAGKLTADDVAGFINDVLPYIDKIAYDFERTFSIDFVAKVLNSPNLSADKAASILNSPNLSADKAASILNSPNLSADKAASIIDHQNLAEDRARNILSNPNMTRAPQIIPYITNCAKHPYSFSTSHSEYWEFKYDTGFVRVGDTAPRIDDIGSSAKPNDSWAKAEIKIDVTNINTITLDIQTRWNSRCKAEILINDTVVWSKNDCNCTCTYNDVTIDVSGYTGVVTLTFKETVTSSNWDFSFTWDNLRVS